MRRFEPFVEKAKSFSAGFRIRRNAFLDRFPVLGKLILILGSISAVVFMVIFVFFLSVRFGAFGPIPSKKELRNISNFTASEVYSADSVLLGKYFIENRTNVSYRELSSFLITALIATEDARFFSHSGVDFRSMFRVFFKTILMQDESSGGGSTLSQQLSKNLYPRRTYRMFSLPVNKVRELIIARRLERVYSKQEILSMYLNTVEFGDNAYGIEVASRRFFNRTVSGIHPEEAAVLIGMLKAPTAYNPRIHPERALNRRNVVLGQMIKYGYLSQAVADSLSALEMKLDFTYQTHNDGLAPYFREYLRKQLDDWCKTVTREDGSPLNLYTDGLKIYTTIDSRMQRYGEAALEEEMERNQASFYRQWGKDEPWGKDLSGVREAIVRSDRYRAMKAKGFSEEEIQAVFEKPVPMKVFGWKGLEDKTISPLDSIKHYLWFLNAGFLVMDPQTGHLLAWVGGINHKFFQYDHVTSRRQAGSTFKPFVYAAALQNGSSPCDYFSNERMVYEKYDNWSPRNANNEYGGEYSMAGGITHSINMVAVDMIMKTGPDKVIRLARNMGIYSPLPEVPSLALGAADVSLLEMVTAYSTFANDGKSVSPVYLLRIENHKGEVLKDFSARQGGTQILTEQQTQIMQRLMQAVVDSGTARRLRFQYNLKMDLAGKTGTTQSQADGWFIGYTPNLVAGAWVGADDRRAHFRNLTAGQGSRTAMPIFGTFMQKLAKDPRYTYRLSIEFPPPSTEVMEMMNCPAYRDGDAGEKFMMEILEAIRNPDDEKQVKKRNDDKLFDRIVQIFIRKKNKKAEPEPE